MEHWSSQELEKAQEHTTSEEQGCQIGEGEAWISGISGT